MIVIPIIALVVAIISGNFIANRVLAWEASSRVSSQHSGGEK